MNRRTLLIAAGGVAVAGGAGLAGWRSRTGSMAEYGTYSAKLRSELTSPDLRGVIRYAALAANSHNTQPWLFRIENRRIEIRPDFRRRTPAVDPDDHHLFVSLGCAAANLELAAAATGRAGEISFTPAGVRYDFMSARPTKGPLVGSVPKRQSTRAEYDRREVSTAVLAELERAARLPGVRLGLIVDRRKMSQVRDLVLEGNEEQMNDQAFMLELKHWLRFNPRSAMRTGDGLFASASTNPVLPTLLGQLAFDRFFSVQGENEKYARHIDSSAGIAIFVGERGDREHWMKVGHACQRFALAATSLGLKLAFINQPVEVARLRLQLASLIGEPRRPDIVMRFGYGPTLPYSPRRPVAAIITQ